MENPLVEAVRKAGLTRAALSLRAGLSYAAVAHALRGYPKKPPQAMLKVLESLGWDAEELERRYVEWRSAYRDH
ncbi:helix-turn-helix protein [Thermaerobacter subterraneus DSM 13965]|uniref:Helix-turn-helix protein n=1 Tax=Thermaerobacter subterraneus DSM 13965 TaxID=867903 RepID=K6PNP4_9FIRM|nr:helix-turn-helix protein [Thermaerobacter subterraneus DSM 13965]